MNNALVRTNGKKRTTKLAERHRPRTRRVVRYSRLLDSTRRYLTDAPTPAKIASYMKDADAGDVAALIELNEEMEAKDSHLQGVASRRREAVTALDWEIIPDIRAEDKAAAAEVAEYAQNELLKIRTWPDTLEHLASAIGPGIAVTELIWQRGRLVETIDVPGHRLQQCPYEGPQFTIETDDNLVDGSPIYSPGYILFTPNARAGFPIRVTITRAQSWLWIIKHFAVADWSAFSETYGQPWRIANITGQVTDKEIGVVEDMLRDMGTDTYGVFSDAVDVKFLEAARNSQPYKDMVDWIERKQSILYLGQTLTTEQGGVGSLALGQVHDNVRASITLSDIQNERRVIREQVLTPMIRFGFPQQRPPIPMFKRQVADDVNIEQQRLRLDQITKATELSLKMDPDWLYEALNIPQPKGESP